MKTNSNRLFIASCIALVATAMTFAIRANMIGVLGKEFSIPELETGIVLSTAFWGFTISMILGGVICDIVGMKKLLLFSFLGHIAGIILTIFASGFWTLFISTLLIGMANGFVEAACNPLIATIYAEEKTKKLNQFHVWFPGGIVIGGLVAYFMDQYNLGWQVQVASILLPTVAYGFLFFNQRFPVTERIASGVSNSEMLKACKSPLFILMVICMLLTAATELGTNQWLPELLGNVGVPSILLLVFINGLMALGRSMAGEFEKKLSASGMLLFSSIFSALGLLLLSYMDGYAAFAAAGIFAIGICFFWPTMLGYVSENIPKTGALGLSIVGSAGNLSVALILPFMGMLYLHQTELNIPQGYAYENLKSAPDGAPLNLILDNAQLAGGKSTLLIVSIMPILLIIVFSFLHFLRNRLKQAETSIV